MAKFETIKIEKGMYANKGKSLTDILEELDPSENYKGTALEGLDAFQRQLKRFDIKVSGKSSDRVEKFFDNSDSAALFPEYVSRAVAVGMERSDVIPDIVAATTRIDGMDYRSITSDPSDDRLLLILLRKLRLFLKLLLRHRAVLFLLISVAEFFLHLMRL